MITPINARKFTVQCFSDEEAFVTSQIERARAHAVPKMDCRRGQRAHR